MYNRIDLARISSDRVNGCLCDTQGKILVNEHMVWDALQMVYPRVLRKHSLVEDLVLFCWEWNIRHKRGNDPIKLKVNIDSKMDVYMCGVWLQVTQDILYAMPKADQTRYAKLQMSLIGSFEEIKK
jgi:hypothetical protein